MAKRTVPITLSDGKERHLRYDFNALIALEETLGISVANLQGVMTGPGSLKAIRGILWAGLIHEDRALTVEAAGELVDIADLAALSATIMDAMSASFGTADGGPKNAETPAATEPATTP